ncbi:tyrosine-type recombinase/integrase [Phytomonospora sp. NPDC050363]|uniref:tyrosine-type recombinase/integrase n=1 Tax=Phytomonospora sp. NPDC050363 TaxID=3155642 RepID=UPI0033EB1CBA
MSQIQRYEYSGELARADTYDVSLDWPADARDLRDWLAGHYPDPGDPLPLLGGAWCASYIESASSRRAAATRLRRWVKFLLDRGLHPLRAAFPHAEAFAGFLRQETAPRTGKPLAPSTRRGVLTTVTAFYVYAASRTHGKAYNPFNGVQLPKLPRTERRARATPALPQDDRDRLMTVAAGNPRSNTLVLLLYITGGRISEVCNLDADDLFKHGGRWVLKTRRKGHSDHVLVPVPDPVAVVTRAYLAGRTSGPLLLSENGLRWDQTGVRRHLKVLAKRAGITGNLRPHTFRASHITDRLAAGEDPVNVQHDVGHASVETTLAYDRRPRELARHAESLDRLSAGLPGLPAATQEAGQNTEMR